VVNVTIDLHHEIVDHLADFRCVALWTISLLFAFRIAVLLLLCDYVGGPDIDGDVVKELLNLNVLLKQARQVPVFIQNHLIVDHAHLA